MRGSDGNKMQWQEKKATLLEHRDKLGLSKIITILMRDVNACHVSIGKNTVPSAGTLAVNEQALTLKHSAHWLTNILCLFQALPKVGSLATLTYILTMPDHRWDSMQILPSLQII